MLPTPRTALCAAAAACVILAFAAIPRPDARAAPQAKRVASIDPPQDAQG